MTVTMSVALVATPGPSAQITISGIVGAASVQIWRGEGGAEVRVAGDDLQIPAGAVFLTDYRLPPGRTVTYRAVLYAAGGSVVGTVSAPALVVPAIDPALAWVMDPEDPTNAMLLKLKAGTDAEVGHESAGVAVAPLVGYPIWLGGPRNMRSRPFVIKTSSLAETAQFDGMISVGNVLLVRPGTALRHSTGLMYVGASSIPERPSHPYEGPARWVFTGTEVADDGWPVVVPSWTWADVKAAYATWADVKAAFSTWIDVKRGV